MSVYEVGKENSSRIFKNALLEKLSKCHWSIPLFYWGIVLFAMIRFTVPLAEQTVLGILGNVLFGLLLWSLLEYTLHRFLFHWELKSKMGERIHFLLHGYHHIYPNDVLRLVLPPAMSTILAVPIFSGIWLFFPLAQTTLIFSGLVLGYLSYDLTHFALHHAPIHSTGFWSKIKKNHMLHHYQDHDKGFGVSPLGMVWDYIFRTHYGKL